ncbi:hypothetical protein F5Y18DRAFT_437656 [Xylariaceae sp. FL1019]|nr:hypothetical protein F5Y18DRAFT_437656 [Xylariaceae sp. FL1019]
MSFGFSVDDFLAVAELVRKVRKSFVGAPDQFRHISNELRCLDHAIGDVEVLEYGIDMSYTQRRRLSEILRNCHELLEDTQRKLESHSVKPLNDGMKGKTRHVWNRLQLRTDDISEFRDRILSSVGHLNGFIGELNRGNIARLVDGQAQLIRGQAHLTEGHNHLLERHHQQEQQTLIDWLASIDYAAQQADIIRRQKKNLLLHGAGKTMTTSIVIDDLKELYRNIESIGICHIFFNFRRTGEQNLENLFGSLLQQLVQFRSDLPRSLRRLYDDCKQRRSRPSLKEILQVLRDPVLDYSKVFVVVDALDECEREVRSGFISELRNLWSDVGVDVFATSRDIPEITSRFDGAMRKEIRACDHDIAKFIDANRHQFAESIGNNVDLWNKIRESIVACVDGIRDHAYAVRNALRKLSKGSDAYDIAYDDVMNRINCQPLGRRQPALKALTWVTYAKQPLGTSQLQHALAIEPDKTRLDKDDIPNINDVISCCCGLLTFDENSNIVRLVHYTTQEYYNRVGGRWFPDADSKVADYCVAYLSLDVFESGRCKNSREYEQRMIEYPLYHYASHRWGNTRGMFSSQILYQPHTPHSQRYQNWLVDSAPATLTPVQIASHFGLKDFVATHLENYIDGQSDLSTPLSHAVYKGRETAARMLIQRGADVNARNRCIAWHQYWPETPLAIALDERNKTMVSLLMESGASRTKEQHEQWDHIQQGSESDPVLRDDDSDEFDPKINGTKASDSD